MAGSANEDRALVLRVWHGPTFRARVTTTDPSGVGQSVVLASPDMVMTYVGEWLARTQRPEQPPGSNDDTRPMLPPSAGRQRRVWRTPRTS